MPVTAFEEGDLFTVRIFKQHVNNPDRQWANNYEFRAKVAGDEADLASLLVIWKNFEKAFHIDQIRLIRATASTWAPDSVPYDPAAFVSVPLSELCSVTETGEDAVALNTCLRVNRVPPSGRFGQVYYRGCLFENDIEAPSGINTLVIGGGADDAFTTALGQEMVDQILGGAHSTWEMVMVNAAGTQIRRVLGLIASGISTVPMNHTWFNRTSG